MGLLKQFHRENNVKWGKLTWNAINWYWNSIYSPYRWSLRPWFFGKKSFWINKTTQNWWKEQQTVIKTVNVAATRQFSTWEKSRVGKCVTKIVIWQFVFQRLLFWGFEQFFFDTQWNTFAKFEHKEKLSIKTRKYYITRTLLKI